MKGKGKRLCTVLGLDGVSLALIRELCSGPVMPNCAALLRKGRMCRMQATLPEISSVSWTSFMTGQNAGRHGIFGFVDLVPGSYRIHFPSALDMKAPTFFDRLGTQGKRSVVINLPGTYPARDPFPGVLICGFVASELDKAVMPRSLLPYLKNIGYRVDVDAGKMHGKEEEFLSDLSYSLSVRRQVLHKMWREEAWDLFLFVVTETDRLQHFFFEAISDDAHIRHAQVMDFFHLLDELVGDIAALSDETDAPLFMLSDHGFYALEKEVYLNPLLRDAGFGGAVIDGTYTGVEVNADTRAFALDPSRIFLHEASRFPMGRVKPEQLSFLKEELKDFFLDLKLEGKQVIRQVFAREQVYEGPQTPRAADLILLSHPGFDLKGGLSRTETFGKSIFNGMHGYDNAFFFCTDPAYLDSDQGKQWGSVDGALTEGNDNGASWFSIIDAASRIRRVVEEGDDG